MKIRRSFTILSMLTILFLICSCVTVNRIDYKELKNDIVLKESWNKFISRNPNPKIVLRVPGYSKDITQAEMSQYESFYNYIEKKLLGSNFTVRDRSLLTSVLNKLGERYSNYSDIGAKVDTQVIIEIVKFTRGDDISGLSYSKDLTTGITGQPSPAKLCGASLECKLILVATNEVVGIFTIKEILPNPYFKQVKEGKHIKYVFSIRESDVEYLNDKISEKLIVLLKGGTIDNSKTSETVQYTY